MTLEGVLQNKVRKIIHLSEYRRQLHSQHQFLTTLQNQKGHEKKTNVLISSKQDGTFVSLKWDFRCIRELGPCIDLSKVAVW